LNADLSHPLWNSAYPRRAAVVALAVALVSCGPALAPPTVPPPAPAPPPVPEPTPALIAGLPPVPRVAGPLAIRVVHPTPDTPRPAVRSTFIYGSVGTGEAMLSINGQEVAVSPNGAFLAFLPVPADGVWELTARTNGGIARATVRYRSPPHGAAAGAPPAAAATTQAFAVPRLGTVTGGADTLATGSDVAIGRPTPTGPYRWFLPRGAQVAVTGRRGNQLRVRLASGVEAWFPSHSISTGAGTVPPRTAIAAVTFAPGREWTEVRVAAGAAPFQVHSEPDRVRLLVYGRSVPVGGAVQAAAGGDLISGARWESDPAGVRLELALRDRLWGYKAFYEPDGTLILRLRHPPAIDAARPLTGIRILIDPGHPPGGATGPTGLTEAEANLRISLPLADLLRARGAVVELTRTDDRAVSLTKRVDRANVTDAHILVSVHNNAFPEGVDPFRRHGTSTYFFHPHARPLAQAMQREILSVTRIPDLGVIAGNLALVRPTWMPAVLTESVFMPLPDQEAALRHPDFTYSLAVAHLRAIEAFLRGE
jgi:N-acetylmuramoyl-L-alanine amidase